MRWLILAHLCSFSCKTTDLSRAEKNLFATIKDRVKYLSPWKAKRLNANGVNRNVESEVTGTKEGDMKI